MFSLYQAAPQLIDNLDWASGCWFGEEGEGSWRDGERLVVLNAQLWARGSICVCVRVGRQHSMVAEPSSQVSERIVGVELVASEK